MEMEVRCFLSAVDAVVLERKYPQRPIRPDECLCHALGRDQYGGAFRVGKIEQRRDVPTRNHATLTDFELPRIDHGEGMFVLLDDLPSFFATCHAKVARFSDGELDHCTLLVGLRVETFHSHPTLWRDR